MHTETRRKETENEIKDTFGFVPEFYKAVPDSALHSAWHMQRDLELGDTALDHKTKELIGLAVASHIKCRYCIYFHTKAAETYGASEQEIREAIAMGGLTVLYSNSITGTQVDFENFREEVDQALEYVSRQKAA